MFSGMLIGWAKPTPVITRNFRKIVRDENLVTLAGPASNLVLVSVALVVLLVIAHRGSRRARDCDCTPFSAMLLPGVNPTVQAAVLLGVAAIEINFALFFFNLLPVPPLDGSHLLRNHAALQRRAGIRPDSLLGKLAADDLRWRLPAQVAAWPGDRIWYC